MSENTEESNSTLPDVGEEESSLKADESKSLDESSKDSEKTTVKDDSVKAESEKEVSENESEEDDEEGVGLLDRPVEVTGCRARKQVERLDVSFAAPKEKHEIPEGKGQKLGDCPRIEQQIQKTSSVELKPLHRILFGRLGHVNEIKRNIRKFSGFPFEKDTTDYEKKKAILEKCTTTVLKSLCNILDLERGGTKDDMLTRVMEFLLSPKDSGKRIKIKEKAGKGKAKSSEKKLKNNKRQKTKQDDSSEDDLVSESTSDKAEDDESDHDQKKSKNASKAKKTPKVVAKKSEKKEKPKKEEKKSAKGIKRKRDADDSDESSEEKPISKKSKMPSDEEIKKLVKSILDAADLQEITMKKVIKQVSEAYPDCDLSHKKAFIKTTIKSVIS